jgi:aspartate racemase
LPALTTGLNALVRCGANAIAMPCYTAHAWYESLARASPVPILHIVDAAADVAARSFGADARLGLVATAGTLATDFCAHRFAERGFDCMLPSELDTNELVAPAIALVKAGEVAAAAPLFERVVGGLLERGAAAVVLGCTEVPVALDGTASPLRARCVDATAALAAACVTFHRCNG